MLISNTNNIRYGQKGTCAPSFPSLILGMLVCVMFSEFRSTLFSWLLNSFRSCQGRSLWLKKHRWNTGDKTNYCLHKKKYFCKVLSWDVYNTSDANYNVCFGLISLIGCISKVCRMVMVKINGISMCLAQPQIGTVYPIHQKTNPSKGKCCVLWILRYLIIHSSSIDFSEYP